MNHQTVPPSHVFTEQTSLLHAVLEELRAIRSVLGHPASPPPVLPNAAPASPSPPDRSPVVSVPAGHAPPVAPAPGAALSPVQVPDPGPMLAQLNQDLRRSHDMQWRGMTDLGQAIRCHSRQIEQLGEELRKQASRFANRLP